MIDTIKTKLTGQHFIKGEWMGDSGTFSSFNPVENMPLDWQFSTASNQDIHTAAKAAKQAFNQYRSTTPIQRAEFLEAIADEIQADIETITTAAHLETGLPMARLQGETGRTCGQLRLFASTLRQPLEPKFVDLANPERAPLPKADTRLSVLPLGPVAVFGASNFPLAFSTAGGDTASALAAGCSVIVKGHPAHAATSELVTHAIEKAIKRCNMPAGVFSLIQGTAPQVSVDLVNQSAIKAVGFTGSLKVGRILADLCAARVEPIPFYGELGSTNPQFLLNQILSDKAEQLASTQVQSMMMGHGQFCTSPGVIIAQTGEPLNRYIATVTEDISSLAASAMLTSGIASTYQAHIDSLLKNPQVNLIAQGQAANASHQTRPIAFRVSAEAYLASEALQQEVFGPCAILVECENLAQMQLVAADLDGQLTATIHGTDAELSQNSDLIEAVAYNVGRLIFNQMPTGVEVCHSMNHGGPYPASTDSRSTSVGSQAMKRFERPICYQNMPESILPSELMLSDPKVMTF
ncbi:aldehyde dehydrogenase (NADP(+)) [Shewanella sp. D64]|uniref:aldehyde dehydrogenase (NADP(+)) n=1 Tax=unclassified Shewanella TaxID=196818 RepID=UPI0022BA6771|nr:MULTISPECIES: aldehyde dehydrogenase (NADP(+)) [unclassified Shewanella]MEC4728786.1 aldehyde dehydrogenase (NADP(+)) [Shewanella sp. D64]MEC4740660.1 aldehyde dehydrogenase (NADP(+)) [Shewanella sp. E94]WBJ93357.1 aldehyde dehydrogenase (NADP(+)) [Shewanella sp. MTB7]